MFWGSIVGGLVHCRDCTQTVFCCNFWHQAGWWWHTTFLFFLSISLEVKKGWSHPIRHQAFYSICFTKTGKVCLHLCLHRLGLSPNVHRGKKEPEFCHSHSSGRMQQFTQKKKKKRAESKCTRCSEVKIIKRTSFSILTHSQLHLSNNLKQLKWHAVGHLLQSLAHWKKDEDNLGGGAKEQS